MESGCCHSENLLRVTGILCVTEVYVKQDKKWFLSTHVLSLPIFDCWKIQKSCFLKETDAFEQTHVLKSGFGLFCNLLSLTDMHSVEHKKWFLVAHLLSLSRFHCSEAPKCWFLTKIINLSRHSIQQWAWQFLDFSQNYREVCFSRKWLLFACFFSL